MYISSTVFGDPLYRTNGLRTEPPLELVTSHCFEERLNQFALAAMFAPNCGDGSGGFGSREAAIDSLFAFIQLDGHRRDEREPIAHADEFLHG